LFRKKYIIDRTNQKVRYVIFWQDIAADPPLPDPGAAGSPATFALHSFEAQHTRQNLFTKTAFGPSFGDP
jgi:hypothetical protein